MKLQQFSGGLNIKDAPHLLKVNQGVKYENIDNESGELKPCKALLAANQTYTERDRYITHLDSIINLAKIAIDFIEYQNKIYYSVLDDFIQMKSVIGNNISEGSLGFIPPSIIEVTTSLINLTVPILSDFTIDHIVIDNTPYETTIFSNTQTYELAFIRVDELGNTSDPFYFTQFPDINIPPRYAFTVIALYDHYVFLKRGNTWIRAEEIRTEVDPLFPADPSLMGKANIEYRLVHTFFVQSEIYYIRNLGYHYESPWYNINGIFRGAGPLIAISYVVDLVPLTTTSGTYVYVVTVGNFELGWESEPSNLVSSIVDSNQVPQLLIDQVNEDLDPRVNRLYVYRISNTITDFTLLRTFIDPVFPLKFVDNAEDTDISGNRILSSENYDKPLLGIKNLNVINGQLVGTLGSKLYFSLIGKLFAIPPANFRDFRDDLTGVFDIDAGLLVCSNTKTWLLNTSNLATGKILRISDEFGCNAHKSMTGFKTGAMWSSRSGLCSSFGGKVELAAKALLGFSNLNITDAKMHDETYFGFSSDGKCIAFDLRYGTAIKKFNFLLFDDSDSNTIIRQVYIDDEDLKVLFGTITATDSYTIFGAIIDETFIWKSPDFIEGAYTDLKTYKDIYIYATKNINFKTFIDSILVDETNFTITDNHHIKVEHERHQGYRISFEAIGKGTIREIEYKAMGSQDGR